MKKRAITIVILVIVVAIIVAAILATQPPPTEPIVTGVVAGNTFTYDLKAYTSVSEDNVTLPQGVSEYNNTEWYKITITSVDGSVVSFNTTWRFVNGTEIERSGYVNVLTDDNQAFWAIYPANLTENKLVRPQGTYGNYVNDTEVRTYKSGDRETNLMNTQTELLDSGDPTRVFDDYRYVHFDKITGMLVELKEIQVYNSPEAVLTYDWVLVGSNVWTV